MHEDYNSENTILQQENFQRIILISKSEKNLLLKDCQMNHWEGSLRFCFVLEAEANFRKGYIQRWCDHGCCIRMCRLWLKQTSCPEQSGEGLISSLFSTGSCALNTGLLLSRKTYLIYLFFYSHKDACLCVAYEWSI